MSDKRFKGYQWPVERSDSDDAINIAKRTSMFQLFNIYGKIGYNYRPQTKFARVMFLHLSVILFTGGGDVERSGQRESQGPYPGGRLGVWPGGVSRPTPKGVSRPRPGGGPGPGVDGGGSQHALRQSPPRRRLLLWTVRILLECILV